ncbi:hypothetical protein ACFYXJ_17090 [Streptomyces sp. NPDC002667]|uniref:hypothetical protein n=1 Tax=Streptomyces sp. NPDC002667 TaxID=3364657 RepID=UPI0036A52EE9
MTNSKPDPNPNPNSPWTDRVPEEDTAPAVTDRGGPARPMICLNGSYATRYLATVEGGREADREEIRKTLRRFGWMMPLVRPPPRWTRSSSGTPT